MLSALASGQLVRDPKSGTSASGTRWANTTIRCPTGQNREGEAESAFVTVLAFNDLADRLAKLAKGDAISVQGNLKQTEYTGKDGAARHGLEILANGILSTHDVRKKRPDSDRASRETSAPSAPNSWGVYAQTASAGAAFDDPIQF